ncbi:unnamed protein product [Amoebophrya sp. A120]|nr:unnamed protein product [Amoebophrya sp. A120]|eukprot:GSA120T00023121001.1
MVQEKLETSPRLPTAQPSSSPLTRSKPQPPSPTQLLQEFFRVRQLHRCTPAQGPQFLIVTTNENLATSVAKRLRKRISSCSSSRPPHGNKDADPELRGRAVTAKQNPRADESEVPLEQRPAVLQLNATTTSPTTPSCAIRAARILVATCSSTTFFDALPLIWKRISYLAVLVTGATTSSDAAKRLITDAVRRRIQKSSCKVVLFFGRSVNLWKFETTNGRRNPAAQHGPVVRVHGAENITENHFVGKQDDSSSAGNFEYHTNISNRIENASKEGQSASEVEGRDEDSSQDHDSKPCSSPDHPDAPQLPDAEEKQPTSPPTDVAGSETVPPAIGVATTNIQTPLHHPKGEPVALAAVVAPTSENSNSGPPVVNLNDEEEPATSHEYLISARACHQPLCAVVPGEAEAKQEKFSLSHSNASEASQQMETVLTNDEAFSPIRKEICNDGRTRNIASLSPSRQNENEQCRSPTKSKSDRNDSAFLDTGRLPSAKQFENDVRAATSLRNSSETIQTSLLISNAATPEFGCRASSETRQQPKVDACASDGTEDHVHVHVADLSPRELQTSSATASASMPATFHNSIASFSTSCRPPEKDTKMQDANSQQPVAIKMMDSTSVAPRSRSASSRSVVFFSPANSPMVSPTGGSVTQEAVFSPIKDVVVEAHEEDHGDGLQSTLEAASPGPLMVEVPSRGATSPPVHHVCSVPVEPPAPGSNVSTTAATENDAGTNTEDTATEVGKELATAQANSVVARIQGTSTSASSSSSRGPGDDARAEGEISRCAFLSGVSEPAVDLAAAEGAGETTLKRTTCNQVDGLGLDAGKPPPGASTFLLHYNRQSQTVYTATTSQFLPLLLPQYKHLETRILDLLGLPGVLALSQKTSTNLHLYDAAQMKIRSDSSARAVVPRLQPVLGKLIEEYEKAGILRSGPGDKKGMSGRSSSSSSRNTGCERAQAHLVILPDRAFVHPFWTILVKAIIDRGFNGAQVREVVQKVAEETGELAQLFSPSCSHGDHAEGAKAAAFKIYVTSLAMVVEQASKELLPRRGDGSRAAAFHDSENSNGTCIFYGDHFTDFLFGEVEENCKNVAARIMSLEDAIETLLFGKPAASAATTRSLLTPTSTSIADPAPQLDGSRTELTTAAVDETVGGRPAHTNTSKPTTSSNANIGTSFDREKQQEFADTNHQNGNANSPPAKLSSSARNATYASLLSPFARGKQILTSVLEKLASPARAMQLGLQKQVVDHRKVHELVSSSDDGIIDEDEYISELEGETSTGATQAQIAKSTSLVVATAQPDATPRRNCPLKPFCRDAFRNVGSLLREKTDESHAGSSTVSSARCASRGSAVASSGAIVLEPQEPPPAPQYTRSPSSSEEQATTLAVSARPAAQEPAQLDQPGVEQQGSVAAPQAAAAEGIQVPVRRPPPPLPLPAASTTQHKNPVSIVCEWFQQQPISCTPTFSNECVGGPDHQKMFQATLKIPFWPGEPTFTSGVQSSMKNARKDCAEKILADPGFRN